MKRNISYILILILLLLSAMITGCGGESDSPASGTEDTAADDAANVVDDMGDLLSSVYVGMMKDSNYLMKYKTTLEFDNELVELVGTVAVSGDKAAFTSVMDGMESVVISKADKSYMIDHSSKTVFEMPVGTASDEGKIDMDGITYIGDGVEDGLIYEEYTTVDSTIKYYFDGKDLVKITVMFEDQTIDMEILEMSNHIPASIFDIPADYEIISM